MATGTFKWYTKASAHMMDEQFDWSTDVTAGNIKVILLKASYAPDATADDTHDFLSDVLTHEITDVGGTAYNARNGDATGGYALATPTVDDTTTTRVTIYGSADLSITADGGNIGDGSTGNVEYYAVFKETGTVDGTDCPLLGYGTIDTPQQVTDGNTFSINFGTSGVAKTTAQG